MAKHIYIFICNEQECPNGEVNEDTFKEIFEKFFPYGSEFFIFLFPGIMRKDKLR